MTMTLRPRVISRDRRTRLQLAVADLALAIDAGEVTPQLLELDALAWICDEEHLPAEAARVRRWMRDVLP